MAGKRDFYEVLEIERTSTVEEIKKAYRKVALKNHPDRNPGDEEAIRRFKEASEAYDVLGDPDKKARYDRYGHAGLGAGAAGGGFQDVSDIFDAFGDLFEGFGLGGGRRRGGGGTRVRRGDNLKTSVTIDMLEAYRGVTKTVKIKRHKACKTCSGTGAKPGTSPVTCDYCGGRGQVVQSQGFFRLQTVCPACQGEGKVVRDKCADCSGSGMDIESQTLEVKIPAGIDNGMQMCLRGEGDIGPENGPRGDLYIDVNVKPHPLFEREGLHLICRVPITFTQAALGTEIEIPALSGPETLKIPSGTQPGEVFKMRHKGMTDPSGRSSSIGDLHVMIQVEVPKKLDKEQEKLLRKLAEHEQANVSPHRKSFFEKIAEAISGQAGSED
jgi:molecular chaperone DnaJ